MRVVALALLLVLACTTVAPAAETTVGVNLTALTGKTASSDGRATLPIGPIPTIEIRTASGIVRAQSEIAPGISAPVSYFASPTTVKLAGGTASIDAALLGAVRPSLGWVRWVQTDTRNACCITQVRRSTFIANGASYGFAIVRHRVWTDAEFSMAFAPRLTGNYSEARIGSPRESYQTVRASQVDIRAAVSGRRRLGTPVIGVRYFNFGAASNQDGRLFDRAAGVFVTFGLRATVGGN